MFGLTAALKLHEEGKRAVVLEAHRVGMGVGGFSTAKLCSLQRNVFSIIQSKFGDDVVKSYGHMSQEGTPPTPPPLSLLAIHLHCPHPLMWYQPLTTLRGSCTSTTSTAASSARLTPPSP